MTAAPPAGVRDAARTLFGARLDVAVGYAELLIDDGVRRGVIGPSEGSRIWDRHLLNCAAIGELIPNHTRLIDVGSGAGFPGLVLAISRPDLEIILVEPLARRTAFLEEAVAALGLDSVRVIRARAEECADDLRAGVVTARAVAPLDRLAAWCLPLLPIGGRLLAVKGASAPDEVAAHGPAVVRLGGSAPEVLRCGVGVVEPPTTVIEIVRITMPARSRTAGRRDVPAPGSRPRSSASDRVNAARKRTRAENTRGEG